MNATVAITRAVPASVERCQLTQLARRPIDIERARQQHSEYRLALAALGCAVIELPEEPELPDSVFVEDCAVVLDECAVLTRPGAQSRRAEMASIRAALSPYRVLYQIEAPGTLDGGDVLRIGHRIFVGLSSRTNLEAVSQLRVILEPLGYEITAVSIQGCLHLKSAATLVAEDLIVANRDTIDARIFGVPYVEVPAEAANMLLVNGTVLCPAVARETAVQLQVRGLRVQLIDNSELAKAEGGLSCCSLLFASRGTPSVRQAQEQQHDIRNEPGQNYK